MTFDDMLAQITDLLKRQGRVSYGALKRRYDLDDAYLKDLKDEIIHAQRLAVDEDNRVLVWVGGQASASAQPPVSGTSELASAPATDQAREPLSYTPKHLAEKILTSRSALEGERKQVTVLFCDLANSTPIAERLGPEHMHSLLNRFFELALDAVHRYEGTINQFLGDGFMALFGAPLSHEDHARRAVFAALALQHTLQEAHLGEPYGVACAFRMGLNSGLVVVGSIGDNLRMDYSAIGDTTNLAARLQQGAAPDTILVSESTSRLVQGAIQLEPLPPIEVRGKTEPVSIYKVVGTLPRRSPIASRSERTLSPFVGRERELATLEALFTQVELGQGQVVGIVAEAGGGKSRLLYEFRQHLQDKRVTYLEGRCLSYGSTIPYHPLIDVLRHNCGISETDHPEAITEKVHLALHEVGMDAEDSAPYLLQLLGVQEGTASMAVFTPEAIRTRTFETLKQMSLQGSQQRPLIFEIEDLHWIDQTSEAYLASLVESLTGASILLLTTYRPGHRPPWVEKSYATQVSLPHLSPQNAVAVIHSTKQQQALPEHLQQVIIGKAEGNPFFLEELTRAVIEHGAPAATIDVPDTIQGVLSARIDRLSEASKRLLQTAAVLGREFAPALLQEMWEGAGPLEAVLLDLKRWEFLYDRPGIAEPIYIFKHALTQEVAYDSLLTTRRQVLHAAAGHAMERLYPDWLAERYEALAHHFTQGAVWEKAFDYLNELNALAFLCLAQWSAGAYVQARTTLRDGMTKAQARENRYIVGRLTNTLGWFHSEFGDGAHAIEHDQASVELGRTAHVSNVEISALINVGLDYLLLRQYDRAQSSLVPTLERVQREAFGVHRWRWMIRLLIGLAELFYATEDHEQALRSVEEGLKEAQRTSSQKYVALGWALRGKIAAKLGDTNTGGVELQRAFSLADQLQSPSLLYPIAHDLGYWYETTGKEREAASLYSQAKATVAQMATAVEDEALCSTFLQSALVQDIHERAARLGE